MLERRGVKGKVKERVKEKVMAMSMAMLIDSQHHAPMRRRDLTNVVRMVRKRRKTRRRGNAVRIISTSISDRMVMVMVIEVMTQRQRV